MFRYNKEYISLFLRWEETEHFKKDIANLKKEIVKKLKLKDTQYL